MANTINELQDCLAEIIPLLRQHEEMASANRLEQIRRWIHEGDFYGVEQLSKIFGGMGSLNDVVVAASLSRREYPSEVIWTPEAILANERLTLLTNRLYQLYQQAKHEV